MTDRLPTGYSIYQFITAYALEIRSIDTVRYSVGSSTSTTQQLLKGCESVSGHVVGAGEGDDSVVSVNITFFSSLN